VRRVRIVVAALLVIFLNGCAGGSSLNVRETAAQRIKGLCSPDARQRILGTVQDAELDEISGAVLSRRQPGVLWVEEDSGNPLRVYALAGDGSLKGAVDLGLPPQKWPFGDLEDIALGPGSEPGRSYLYVGDIGNNPSSPDKTGVPIYRFPEPDVGSLSPDAIDQLGPAGVGKITLTYPDGPHDAESLFVDPVSGRIFIVTKEYEPKTYVPRPSGVYRAPAHLAGGDDKVLERVATIDFTKLPTGSVQCHFSYADNWRVPTAAAISADGSVIAIREYCSLHLWTRSPGESVAKALSRSPACQVPFASGPQGEAVGIGKSGGSWRVLLLSEGVHPSIFGIKAR